MAFTAEQQTTFFQNCYGCNPNEFVESVEASVTFKLTGPSMAIMSLLSDAQEELEHGMKDEARKTINRAKFLVNHYMNSNHV